MMIRGNRDVSRPRLRLRPAVRICKLTSRISICASIIALTIWAVSVFVAAGITSHIGTHFIGCDIENGILDFTTIPDASGSAIGGLDVRPSQFWPGLHWDLIRWSLGLRWPEYDRTDLSDSALRNLTTPLWLITLIAATPAVIIRFINKRRARRLGLCPKCNYNLKHNQSGKCPECGMLISLPNKIENTPLTDAQLAELRNRLAEYHADPKQGSPWHEVRTEIEKSK